MGSSARLLQRARKAIQATLGRYEREYPREPAVLCTKEGYITGAGTSKGTKKYHSYVRRTDDGQVLQIWNTRVPNVIGTQVWIGYDKFNPSLLQVLSTIESYSERTVSPLVEHHTQHEWANFDVVYVHPRQMLPLRISVSGFIVTVEEGVYQGPGQWVLVSQQSKDLSSYIPGSGGRWVLLTLDENGLLTATAGSIITPVGDLDFETHCPLTPDGHLASAAVRLYSGQTAITDGRTVYDIIDLRFLQPATTAFNNKEGGHWEPVTNGDAIVPLWVFDTTGDLAMAWVE